MARCLLTVRYNNYICAHHGICKHYSIAYHTSRITSGLPNRVDSILGKVHSYDFRFLDHSASLLLHLGRRGTPPPGGTPGTAQACRRYPCAENFNKDKHDARHYMGGAFCRTHLPDGHAYDGVR